jgi:antitoxin component of MazEF toxin-antitoxin module
MKRLRPITKWGGTHVIRLSITDMDDLNFKEGDLVDVSNLIKEEKRKNKNKTRNRKCTINY